MWVFADTQKTSQGILNFALKDFNQAYTQSNLPWGKQKDEQPFLDGF